MAITIERPRGRRSRRLIVSLALVAMLAACEWSALLDSDDDENAADDNTPPVAETNVPGFSVAEASDDFDTTANRLRNTIATRVGLSFLLDHQANAPAGLSLRPTTVMFFDAPNRSAPLIQADRRVALDLPARMLVYQDGSSDVAVAFTNRRYLESRYRLDDAEEGALQGFQDDLETIASDVTGSEPSQGAASDVALGEGIESVTSDNDFTTTVSRLRNEIAARGPLSEVAVIDFQQNAARFGRPIDPSVLIVFGNPNAGTPLMQASQTAGIDLPQKMLVSADGQASVTVYYNDPRFIADRHDIVGQDQRLADIADLLAELADIAASTSPGTTAPGVGSPDMTDTP